MEKGRTRDEEGKACEAGEKKISRGRVKKKKRLAGNSGWVRQKALEQKKSSEWFPPGISPDINDLSLKGAGPKEKSGSGPRSKRTLNSNPAILGRRSIW